MTLERIKELIDLIAAAPIAELVIEENGETVRLLKRAPAASATTSPRAHSTNSPEGAAAAAEGACENAAEPAPSRGATSVVAPMYGVFHRRPSPHEANLVELGSHVAQGQSLCVIEAMKTFNSVQAGLSGRIVAVLAEDGREVDRGQPLFKIE